MNAFKAIFSNGDCEKKLKELEDKFLAVSETQAVIEFSPNGKVLDANENFLSVMGYSQEEIVGQHHSLFVDTEYRNSEEYKQFWDALARGEQFTKEYKRIANGGREVWIIGSYNPLLDDEGKVYKVIKFASEITDQKLKALEQQAVNDAASKSQAVIEFNMDGTIITANDNFLSAVGYELSEIQGQHHRMFVSPEDASSDEYADFWAKLNRGEYESREYKRYGKNGKEIWIQASYNPVMGVNGKPVKVIKFASDITGEKLKSQESKRLANLSNALMLCQAGVMLADNDMNIVYLNREVKKMLSAREETIKNSLPNFSVDNLIGSSVDAFHKKPAHQQSLISGITEPYETNLEISDLTFSLVATPWLDVDGERIGTVVEWEDKTEQIAAQKKLDQISEENALTKKALDTVSANVMMANVDAEIIYTNDAVIDMMKNAESDIRKGLPNFDADSLMGANIDVFHKDPSHQRNILANLKDTYFGKAAIGGRNFTVIANPVFQNDRRVGTVVEWSDKTVEFGIEKEIDDIVSAVSQGDFTQQASLEGKTGFYLTLSQSLNSLTSTVEVALNDIIRMLGAISRGDLSERITRDYQGTFGQLKTDANATADKLTEVISKILVSTNSILTASSEIAQGNADLSQRTEEQASSLEETASSMEQMTSAVKQSAENAVSANERALETQDKAQHGGQVVERAVSAMGEINQASKKISDIIGVIDEIAFQTNLLALNAAVEAARAGEQGRGFAVVAGEVRNLAQRSAGAAKEIKDLIRDTVNKVEDGTQLVNQSGETLSEIVSSVHTVTTMMSEIAEAAREQTSGIEQVNSAVSQMDEMTQQNAALVEEATAAGESMAEQSRSMADVVAFFSTSSSLKQAKVSAPSSVSKKVDQGKPNSVAAKIAHVESRPKTKPSFEEDDIESFGSTSNNSADDEWEDF